MGSQLEHCPVRYSVTVIDFTAFIDRLATASGETILPFFRTSLLDVENKSVSRDFDPVTEADRAKALVALGLIDQGFGIKRRFAATRPGGLT